MMRILATLLVLLLASPAHADESPRQPPVPVETEKPAPRVGVIVELAVNVDTARADELAAALADALNRELRVDAFGGQDVTRSLPDGGLPDECLAHTECIQDVAGRIDAQQLLFLVLVQVGVDVQVDSSWVDVATGTVSSRPRVVLGSDARAVSVFAAGASRFLPDAEKRKDTILIGNGNGNGNGDGPSGPSRHMTTLTWITAGTGAAALIAGVALAVSARVTFDKCDRQAGGCSDAKLDGLATRALAADLSLVVAAGCGIATAILYWRSDSSGSPDERASVGVAPVAGGAMLGLAGHF